MAAERSRTPKRSLLPSLGSFGFISGFIQSNAKGQRREAAADDVRIFL
jgi:hypothetical protein